MQTLKLRAWHKELKRMYPVLSIEQIDTKHMRAYSSQGDIFSINEIELMQWTGLHDIYDNPIFDGDIVKHIHMPIADCYIVRHIGLEGRYAMFGIKNKMEGVFKFTEYALSAMFEIIGNIYENHELLDMEKK